jgi:hypothetical protein
MASNMLVVQRGGTKVLDSNVVQYIRSYRLVVVNDCQALPRLKK